MKQISELFATEFSAISVGHLLLCVGLSFVLSLYIVFVYRTSLIGVR